LSLPERIGRYRILGFLASGGMAEILLAKLIGPGGFERAVVVKRVLPHLARQSEFRDMFLDEARIVARIRHPNVVDVSELGQEGRELFMVMEYLAGESVGGLMRRLGQRRERLDPAMAVLIAAEAAAGLHAAHELRAEDGTPLGVVHRDVSPQNIFLTYDGAVKVLDFGIAKFEDRSVETHTGQLKGKFAYMSPEQCRADGLDRRSDVFSLGILLWELLTGARLFQRPNELLVWKAIVEEPAPPASERLLEQGGPALPAALERVLQRALDRDRAQRHASAAELRRELVAVARELDPEGTAAERLAALMHEVFPDRIQQKEEILRRVRAGDVITSVPSAEVDIDVEVTRTESASASKAAPTGHARAMPLDTDPNASAPIPAPSPGARSARTLAFASLLVVAILVGAWLGLEGRGEGREATAAEARTAAPAPLAPLAQGGAGAQGGGAQGGGAPTTPDVRRSVVRVQVETTPPGASVIIAGVPRGVTPLSVELPRGEEAVELSIALEGHRSHVERMVPDVDQRVRFTLDRDEAERSRPRGGRPRAGAPRGGTSGEGTTGAGEGTGSRPGEFFRFD
jgi:eukaryotic-like serine/threonine-protein kinase